MLHLKKSEHSTESHHHLFESIKKSPRYNLSAITLFAISIVSFLVSYLLNVCMTHLFTPTIYGDISTALYFFGIASGVVVMGMTTPMTRFFTGYYNDKNTSRMKNFIDWYFTCLWRNGLIIFILAFFSLVLLLSINYYFPSTHLSFQRYIISLLFISISPVSAYATMLFAQISSSKSPVFSRFLSTNVLILLIIIPFVFCLKIKPITINYFFIIIVYFVCYSIISLIALCYSRYQLHSIQPPSNSSIAKNSEEIPADRWSGLAKKSFHAGIFLGLADYLNLIILNIMSYFRPEIRTEHQIGIYSCVLSIVGIYYILPMMFSKVIQEISLAITSHTEKELNKETTLLFSYTLFFITIISVVLIIDGRAILRAFGAEYVHGYHLLLLLMLDGILYVFFYYSMTAMTVSGLMSQYLSQARECFFIFILLSCILTFFYTMYGMAIATVIAWGYFGIRCYFILKKNTGLKGFGII